jgi:hypothetical protein
MIFKQLSGRKTLAWLTTDVWEYFRTSAISRNNFFSEAVNKVLKGGARGQGINDDYT